jgi:hypothetical protein
MRTYSAHHKVTGFGHPLNRGLRGYYQSNLPWVPQAAGYGPKLLDPISSLQRHMAGEPYTPYEETTPPLQVEEVGSPT